MKNMGDLQKMAREMQANMAKAQAELAEATIEGTAGGGAVVVVLTGTQDVRSVHIQKDAVDPEDVETLQDLVVAAFTDALKKSRELAAQRLGGVTGGLKLPGVGPKTAQRLAYHILRAPLPDADALAAAIRSVKTDLRYCSVCFNIAEADPCVICSSDERDGGLVCVVEEPLDVLAIERTGQYKGRYHVLHGAISPVNGVRPDDLKIAQLVQRVRGGGIEELILATNPNLEGEATSMYVAQLLAGSGVRVTRLARGLPMGGDLEYADEVTVSRALEGRRAL